MLIWAHNGHGQARRAPAGAAHGESFGVEPAERSIVTRVRKTADQIIDFIEHQMRMSHVYQPLLIRALVRTGGSATVRQLAAALLMEDESQLRYYEDRIRKMPCQSCAGTTSSSVTAT
jgi:hypothetical protein